MRKLSKENITIIGLCLIPLFLLLDSMLFTTIALLISTPSDMAVLTGVCLLCILLLGNVLLIKKLVKVFSKQKVSKNEESI